MKHSNLYISIIMVLIGSAANVANAVEQIDNKPDTNELRISFGVPYENSKYSFTSAWGDSYEGNVGIIALFYAVNSASVKVNSLG